MLIAIPLSNKYLLSTHHVPVLESGDIALIRNKIPTHKPANKYIMCQDLNILFYVSEISNFI